tara:strand:+ start:1391 stop:1660 length:270 start_codon:yes stop_codon:yes gene_type:complete
MPISSNVDAFGSEGTFGSGLQEEDVSSQINGVTQTFVTASAFDTTSIVIYWNGVRQRTGVEITVVNAKTFTTQFIAPNGSTLVAVYKPL